MATGIFLVLVLAANLQAIIAYPQTGRTLLPEGPPRPPSLSTDVPETSEPQPPAIPVLVKAPAPPLESDLVPEPPAEPDPELIALFERDPDNFAENFAKWQKEKEQMTRKEKRDAGLTTFDSFMTLALVVGLDMRSGNLTFFAPSDSFLKTEQVSLATIAINNPPCAAALVRSHVAQGKQDLEKNPSLILFSLDDNPIFIEGNEVNGIKVEKSDVISSYGVVHVLNGIFVSPAVAERCPELQKITEQNLETKKTPQNEFLDVQLDSLDLVNKQNGLDSPLADPLFDVVLPNAEPQTVPEEAGVHDLLATIDDFAKAMKLTWESHSNIVGVLQRLGASTLLALLERANLLDMLAYEGPWTVFAPSNKAWEAIPEHAFNYIAQTRPLLEQVLTYHIVPHTVQRKDFNQNFTLESLNSRNPIHINFYTDGLASWYTASGSMISNLDETASNGVVHVVDNILLPPFGNLSSAVKATPALQKMSAFIQAAKEHLERLDVDLITAFLPVDSVLNSDSVLAENRTATDIVQQHIVHGVWFTSGLVNGDELFALNGERLRVTQDSDCTGVNGACILVRDITLTNGVLHVVNQVL